MYSTGPVYTLPNSQNQSHHMNTTSASPLTNRSRPTNQVPPNTRYIPGLTPIAATVIQSNTTNSNTLMAGGRNRVYSAPMDGDIIDLSSPPHSPPPAGAASMNNISLGNSAKYNNHAKPPNTSQERIVQLPECNSAAHTFPYKVGV